MSLQALAGTRALPRGFGATTAQVVGSSVGTTLLSAGGIIAAIPGLQLPGAIIAAVGAIAGPIISMFNGCGQTCIQATQYANQAADALNQIKTIYFQQPAPRPKSLQVAVLAQIQQIFDALHQACGNPALGDAGRRCISERLVEGGTAPWCPTSTGCDWVTAYYRPIANDPQVYDDSAAAQAGTVVSGISNSISANPLAWGLGALLVVGVWMAS